MMVWEDIGGVITDDHDVHSCEIIESKILVVEFLSGLGFRSTGLRPNLKTLTWQRDCTKNTLLRHDCK